MPSPYEPAVATPSPLVTRTLLGCFVAMFAVQAMKFAGLFQIGAKKTLTDFDAFHITARMIWMGRLEEAYHFATLVPAQRELGGADSFMPWTYPPPFDLVVAPLGLLPVWLGYLVFVTPTFAAYLYVLRKLAPDAFRIVLIALFPAVSMTAACGQNGFLTGALIGLACLGLRHGDARAGIPLGLMAMKPHLAVCFGLYTLATRRWLTAGVALAVALAFSACATLAFGASVWNAFLEGVREARIFLAAGEYPLFRMVSPYAVLFTLGLPARAAMAAQALVALTVLGGLGFAILRKLPTRQVLGLSAMTSVLVSPYAYDYDLMICGVGLALLVPDLMRLATQGERIAMVVLSWLASGWGLAQSTLLDIQYGTDGAPDGLLPLSLGGAFLCLGIGLVCRVLAREHRPVTTAAITPEPVRAPA